MSSSFPDYRNYTRQQLLEDPHFQMWVFHPTNQSEQFWSEWMLENPDQIPLIEEAKELLLSLKTTEFELSQEEVEDVWTDIQSKIGRKGIRQGIFEKGWVGWRNWAAAGVAFIIVIGMIWKMVGPEQVKFSTGFAETLAITLPDGSNVILNSNSSLTFTDNWETLEGREVFLIGEAFFEVVHELSQKPFFVNTPSGMEVEVLGTSFTVYNRDQKSQVVLQEGKVSLSLPNNSKPQEKILMQPGDLVSVLENKIEKRKVKAENYKSWTQNLLILDQTSLEEIIRVARENFGLIVEVDPAVSMSQTASGSMPLENPDHFMDLTGKIFSITIENNNSKYQITP